MNRHVQQFDSISGKYSSFVDIDPVRNYLHYPGVLQVLGDIKGKDILDIGCGDGFFARMMAKEYGAHVLGFDKAADLISIADKEQNNEQLSVSYVVADPVTFSSEKKFDESVSVMVLSYSPEASYLVNFFRSAYDALKQGGRFISVTTNPEFTAFDEMVANRVFKMKNEEVEVNFLNPETKELQFTANLTQYTKNDYENAAKEAGFNKIEWRDLYATDKGKEVYGEDFWKRCEETQPYTILVTEK